MVEEFDFASKGASFLVYEESNGHFRVAGKVRYEDEFTKNDIETYLTLENSLAGRVYAKETVVQIHDCSNPSPGITWISPRHLPRFLGRAAVPVQIIDNKKPVPIGVLCIDVKEPCTLSNADIKILKAAAKKLAYLWLLRQSALL